MTENPTTQWVTDHKRVNMVELADLHRCGPGHVIIATPYGYRARLISMRKTDQGNYTMTTEVEQATNPALVGKRSTVTEYPDSITSVDNGRKQITS